MRLLWLSVCACGRHGRRLAVLVRLLGDESSSGVSDRGATLLRCDGCLLLSRNASAVQSMRRRRAGCGCQRRALGLGPVAPVRRQGADLQSVTLKWSAHRR